MDKKNIQKDYHTLQRLMRSRTMYTINELEGLSGLDTTDLCLALIVLLRNNEVVQERKDNVVYYSRLEK